MSWAQLVESSLVLTTRGWEPIGDVGSEAALVGVDRAGRPATATVLTERGGSVRPVFLGARSAAGWLAPDTTLIADGSSVVALDLVRGDVRNARFETHMDVNHVTDVGELIWVALSRAACFVASEAMVIPKRDRQAIVVAPWLRTIERHGRPYAILNKEALMRAILMDWAKAVHDLCPILHYRSSSEEGYRCPLALVDILTWILSALRASGRGYILSFDSLQFSPFVDVLMRQGRPLPLEQGACAFFHGEEEHAITVLWQGSSWSPIIAGFVAAPGSAKNPQGIEL